MGIKGLWEILGEGHIVSIAELATRHIKEHGRPFRIAVDEAGWRFKNLSEKQVAVIREGVPPANPIEKQIFYRVIRLLKLNIQLLFVFDGPRRPWKRGKQSQGRIDYQRVQLLRETLRNLGVSCHSAPGEAEAECARLQDQGRVDAVWSDDSDTLMFGCGLLLRTHYDKGAKSHSHVRLYDSKEIRRQHGLDRYGMVLMAMLSGGDYDVQGVKGIGPRVALEAARLGLGRSLCETSDAYLPVWRQQLVESLRFKAIEIPHGFPDPKTLKKYASPVVSAPDVLEDVPRHGWTDRTLDEFKLRQFLLERYNIRTKEYIKHIVPLILTRSLLNTEAGNEDGNRKFEIEISNTRTKKTSGDDFEHGFVRKITFDVRATSSLDLTKQPDNEDWSELETKAGPFEPPRRTDCEVLECTLQRGVPQALATYESKKKMEKATAVAEGEGKTSKRVNKQSSSESNSQSGNGIQENESPDEPNRQVVTKKRKAKEQGSRSKKQGKIDDLKASSTTDESAPVAPPPKLFKPSNRMLGPAIPQFRIPTLFPGLDLEAITDDEDHADDLKVSKKMEVDHSPLPPVRTDKMFAVTSNNLLSQLAQERLARQKSTQQGSFQPTATAGRGSQELPIDLTDY